MNPVCAPFLCTNLFPDNPQLAPRHLRVANHESTLTNHSPPAISPCASPSFSSDPQPPASPLVRPPPPVLSVAPLSPSPASFCSCAFIFLSAFPHPTQPRHLPARLTVMRQASRTCTINYNQKILITMLSSVCTIAARPRYPLTVPFWNSAPPKNFPVVLPSLPLRLPLPRGD
jgi:hypothetical protein